MAILWCSVSFPFYLRLVPHPENVWLEKGLLPSHWHCQVTDEMWLHNDVTEETQGLFRIQAVSPSHGKTEGATRWQEQSKGAKPELIWAANICEIALKLKTLEIFLQTTGGESQIPLFLPRISPPQKKSNATLFKSKHRTWSSPVKKSCFCQLLPKIRLMCWEKRFCADTPH